MNRSIGFKIRNRTDSKKLTKKLKTVDLKFQK